MTQQPFTPVTVRQYPKVDLHCHLEGSLSLGALREMAAVTDTPLPVGDRALHDLLIATATNPETTDYLKRFQPVIDLMQTAKQLEIAGADIVRTAAADGLIYMETRFTPTLYTQGDLNLGTAIAALLRGLHAGTKTYGVPVNAIVCGRREGALAELTTVFETAAKFTDQGVVGLDLVGDEAEYPTIDLADAIRAAHATGLPIALHAGETAPVDNVVVAMTLQVERIGHGQRLNGFPAAMARAKRTGTTLETCLTSSHRSVDLPDYPNLPLQDFLDAGLKVTVNTNHRTIADVNLTDEILALHDHSDLDWDQLAQLTHNAIDGAFLKDADKTVLHAKVPVIA